MLGGEVVGNAGEEGRPYVAEQVAGRIGGLLQPGRGWREQVGAIAEDALRHEPAGGVAYECVHIIGEDIRGQAVAVRPGQGPGHGLPIGGRCRTNNRVRLNPVEQGFHRLAKTNARAP